MKTAPEVIDNDDGDRIVAGWYCNYCNKEISWIVPKSDSARVAAEASADRTKLKHNFQCPGRVRAFPMMTKAEVESGK